MELRLKAISGKDIAQNFDEHQNQLNPGRMVTKYLEMKDGKTGSQI